MPSTYIKRAIRTIRALFTTLYLILIVLTIPIAFQVGGVNCGLAFTVTLFNIYGILTVFRLFLYKNALFQFIYYSQHLLIPSLLTLFLSIFTNKEFEYLKNNEAHYKFFINPWRLFILNSTPLFTIFEGLCSILAIQAIGQTFTWLKVKKSESWVIVSLLASGGIITTSLYFLYKIYCFPIEISTSSSSLIGAILTFSSGLGLYGIVSNKGSTIESSLLFAYIVRCIYETFPELSHLASNEIGLLISSAANQLKQETQHLPLVITDSFTNLLSIVALNAPNSFQAVIEFLIAACKNITPAILINLAYRVSVFYSATRIIPALKSPEPSTKVIRIIYAFSPCIVIAVYTHLMMQYSNELEEKLCLWGCWFPLSNDVSPKSSRIYVDPGRFWNWINMFSTLGLYAVELFGEQTEEHWKID